MEWGSRTLEYCCTACCGCCCVVVLAVLEEGPGGAGKAGRGKAAGRGSGKAALRPAGRAAAVVAAVVVDVARRARERACLRLRVAFDDDDDVDGVCWLLVDGVLIVGLDELLIVDEGGDLSSA